MAHWFDANGQVIRQKCKNMPSLWRHLQKNRSSKRKKMS